MSDLNNVVKGFFGARTALGSRLENALKCVPLSPTHQGQLAAVSAFANSAKSLCIMLQEMPSEDFDRMRDALLGIMEGLTLDIQEENMHRQKKVT